MSKRLFMGKKTRIVLLSITVAIAVFTFATMWIVRPDSQSAVLDAARERQNQPLLSVSEPLETDAAVLSAEEEMAQKVSGILSGDEDFISALAAAIASRITLDEYIPGITESVYARISDQYDAIADDIASRVSGSFEDDVIALYQKHKETVVSDIVLAILEEYDALSDEEKSEILGLEPQLIAIYEANREAIVADVAAALPEDIDREELEAVVMALIADAAVEGISEDDVKAAIEAYAADDLTEDDVEAIVMRLYDEYRDAIAEDIGKEAAASVPAPAAAVEKAPISVPSFSDEGLIPPDSSAEEYQAARTEMRKAEIEKALQFIAQ